MAYKAKTLPYLQPHMWLKRGFWIDHPCMVSGKPRSIDMNVSKLETKGWPTRWPRARTIEQIREFLEGTAEVEFSNPTDPPALRAFVVTVLRRYRYFRLSKGPRGALFTYMQHLSWYPRQHLSRLITQYRESHSLKPRKRVSCTSFARQYTVEDVHCWRRPTAWGARYPLGPGNQGAAQKRCSGGWRDDCR